MLYDRKAGRSMRAATRPAPPAGRRCPRRPRTEGLRPTGRRDANSQSILAPAGSGRFPARPATRGGRRGVLRPPWLTIPPRTAVPVAGGSGEARQRSARCASRAHWRVNLPASGRQNMPLGRTLLHRIRPGETIHRSDMVNSRFFQDPAGSSLFFHIHLLTSSELRDLPRRVCGRTANGSSRKRSHGFFPADQVEPEANQARE